MNIINRLGCLAITAFAVAAQAKVPADVPRCGLLHPDPEALEARETALDLSGRSRLAPAVAKETRLDVIDLLLGYDLSAQQWLKENGKGSVEEHAKARVEALNNCLKESKITDFTFRLAGVVRIEDDATKYKIESVGIVDYVTILSGKLVAADGTVVATGPWAAVPKMRDSVGADIVCVQISSGRLGMVGLAYGLENSSTRNYAANPSLIAKAGDWGYCVCSIDMEDYDYTQLHEIGHVMGCGHADPDIADVGGLPIGPQLFDYSAAYYLWYAEDAAYYTIMGYNYGGKRPDGSLVATDFFKPAPIFSSPELTYDGVVAGDALHDNRRTLMTVYPYIAQFRVSKQHDDTGPEDEPDPGTRIFQLEYRPAKAVNGASPYVGAVTLDDEVVAVVSLKCGKAGTSGKKLGIGKLSASVTGFDGKTKSSKAVDVKCGYDAAAALEVKDWGTLKLTLGGEGFIGTLRASDGKVYEVKTANVGGEWPSKATYATVEFNDLSMIPGEPLAELLPTGENGAAITVVNGKWKFAKAATVKYAKAKGESVKSLIVDTGRQGEKSNLSAMKLSYKPKNGLIKGSFKLYSLQGSGDKAKLKKFTVKASGLTVGQIGHGEAVLKSPYAQWPMTVQ